MTPILFFSDTLDHIINTIRAARVESLPFKYFLDTSPHTLTDILPAYVEDPPTQRQILAFGLGIHSFPPYAVF